MIAIGLACCAAVVAAEGDIPGAARLWGAADALLDEAKLVLLPAEALRSSAEREGARGRIAPAAFDAAYNEGYTLGWEATYERLAARRTT
jgi:hypothetical protein